MDEQKALAAARQPQSGACSVYEGVMLHGPTPMQLARLEDFLGEQTAAAQALPMPAIPRDLEGLLNWSRQNQADVSRSYQDYLAERKAGAPRRYFRTRSHALYFLRGVAPTKLVDGAWLYAAAQGEEVRSSAGTDNLLRTYFDELGNGDPGKNHVALYRKLLMENGLEQWRGLPERYYTQGAIQLGLAWRGKDMMPEVIGFNLGYEQLPLHLLITAYELDELGIDPYYFTLHVTVDNPDTGHARRACEAAVEGARDLAEPGYWERLALGFRLNDLGAGTLSVIEDFDLEREALEILGRKAQSGHGSHSDYCRIEGRTVNEWLAQPAAIGAFVDALQRLGWIRRGQEPGESRFWNLLQGERARMFGVFNDYELQVLFDWIRAEGAVDGRPFFSPADEPVHNHRVAERRRARELPALAVRSGTEQADRALRAELEQVDSAAQVQLLKAAISPAQHWTPRGLAATRLWLAANTGT